MSECEFGVRILLSSLFRVTSLITFHSNSLSVYERGACEYTSHLTDVLSGLRVILQDDGDEHVDDGDGGHDEVRHHERVGHEHAIGR